MVLQWNLELLTVRNILGYERKAQLRCEMELGCKKHVNEYYITIFCGITQLHLHPAF